MEQLLYAFVHAFHGTSGKEYTMVFARFIVGFGAGSMAVCNAYVAAATTLEERTGAMGLVAVRPLQPSIVHRFVSLNPPFLFNGVVSVPRCAFPHAHIVQYWQCCPT